MENQGWENSQRARRASIITGLGQGNWYPFISSPRLQFNFSSFDLLCLNGCSLSRVIFRGAVTGIAVMAHYAATCRGNLLRIPCFVHAASGLTNYYNVAGGGLLIGPFRFRPSTFGLFRTFLPVNRTRVQTLRVGVQFSFVFTVR